ncbi:MAG: DUF2147 domain-containing protein [Ignavibacteriales bacterium]
MEGTRKTVRGLRARWGLVLVVAAAFLCPPQAMSEPAIPQGVWLMDGRVAVQIFECETLMCGRIIWLAVPRDPQGLLDRDKKNPDPALRQRKLCGLTVLWGLHPVGADRWRDGWFYNPDDGVTYRVKAQLKSADVLVARVYVGVPLLGKTKTLVRVTHDTSEGWC